MRTDCGIHRGKLNNVLSLNKIIIYLKIVGSLGVVSKNFSWVPIYSSLTGTKIRPSWLLM